MSHCQKIRKVMTHRLNLRNLNKHFSFHNDTNVCDCRLQTISSETFVTRDKLNMSKSGFEPSCHHSTVLLFIAICTGSRPNSFPVFSHSTLRTGLIDYFIDPRNIWHACVASRQHVTHQVTVVNKDRAI